MFTDSDLAIAIVVALVLLIIILCVWPGLLRIHTRDLLGYWAGAKGDLHSINPTAWDHNFVVSTKDANGTPVTQPGYITGLRGLVLRLPDDGKDGVHSKYLTGSVDFGGRRINWADGESWTLQGVH